MTPRLVALLFAMLIWASTAHGQGLGLPNQSRELPIEILADNGIEWQPDAQAYIARGNAKAKQGDVTVHADQLTAYYEKGADGGTQIWRIDADGHVRITTPQQTAYGEKGVYQVTKGVFVLTGSPRLVTKTDKITAKQSIEFFEAKSLAVARGNAVVIRGDKRLSADVVTAYFVKGKGGKIQVERVDAYDNVVISTPDEIVRGHRGVYYTKTGVVVLRGSVKITRGNDQLNGEAAEVDLNTGVSRLLSNGTGQVRGLFQPKRKLLGGRPAPKQQKGRKIQ
jgi:lipopolysaccharide export system protein LptA